MILKEKIIFLKVGTVTALLNTAVKFSCNLNTFILFGDTQ